jgi:hypothetical protein
MPRFSAPVSRFQAPAVSTAPQIAPHIVAPRFAAPNVAAPSGRALLTPNVAPSSAIGSGLAARNREAGGSPQSVMQGRNGGPILRNPTYANISTGDPANRALAQSTFGGRFAHSRFDLDGDRHHHHFGRVIGFLGPVFWPYAYDDFFNYTFSPYAYDTFWPYAYDDVLNGIYGPYAPGYADYTPNAEYTPSSEYTPNSGYTPNSAPDSEYAPGKTVYVYGNESGAWMTPEGHPLRTATLGGGAGQICAGQPEGLADFPIQRIAQQIRPDQNQQPLLDDLKAATAEALEILRAACPSDLPSTPTGRLAAVRSRIEAMLRAVRVIDPALQRFYLSLSDEQKERLNTLDAQRVASAENRQPDPAQLCSGEAQAANLPITSIEQALRLKDAQQANFNALKEASAKAGDILKANCPSEPALTPTSRLAHMKQRLEAMMQLLDTVQPALVNFYGSLDDEQKARFNRLGVQAP